MTGKDKIRLNEQEPVDSIDLSTGKDKELQPAAKVIRWISIAAVYLNLFAGGVLLLALALGLLTFAWQELTGETQSILDQMTERGTVTLQDTMLCIMKQAGPGTKSDPDRVLGHYDFFFELILNLDFLPKPEQKSYRISRTQEFSDIGNFWPVMEKEPMFRTTKFNVKFDTDLYKLMTGTPARSGKSFTVLDAPEDAPREQRYWMGSMFDQFWVWIDWPAHTLALEWLSGAGNMKIPVRYDPQKPENFLFEDAFAKAYSSGNRRKSLVNGIFFAGFGLFVLMFAVGMLTKGRSKYVSIGLYLGMVALVPLVSPFFHKAIDYMGNKAIDYSGKIETAGYFLKEMTQSADSRFRLGFLNRSPDSRESDTMILPVDMKHSRYADVFGYFHFSKGARQFSSFEEAMDEISSQIKTQMIALPTKDLLRFFKILDNHMSQRRKGWAAPFLEGVQTIALDTGRSSNLRSWAISAFCDLCFELHDPKLSEFIYHQYVDSQEDVKKYWRRNFWNYYQSPTFISDLNSNDPVRIKRALLLWMNKYNHLGEVQFLVPRLKKLTNFPDPEIREMAQKKWNSRTDWDRGQ